MFLAVDIGNSAVKFAVFRDAASPLCHFKISASPARSSDEYRLIIRRFLAESDPALSVSAAVIASVVPSLTAPISRAAEEISGAKPFLIGAGTHTGFPIRIGIHAQLGADLVANVAAAKEILAPPFVVLDLGTATTFTAVDRSGCLSGAVIHPGLSVCLDALARSAALLAETPLSGPSSLIGTTSDTSVQSGLIFGHAAMIDGLLDRLESELCPEGETLSLVATGGCAGQVLPYCSRRIPVSDDLTLRGSAILYEKNRKK